MQPSLLRLVNLGLRVLTLVSKFALIFFLARFLEPSQVGLYGLLAATISYALFLVGFDFYTYTTREFLKHDKSEWGRLIRSQLALSGVLYSIFVPLLAVVFISGILPLQFALWFALLLVTEHMAQELNRILVAVSEQVVASVVLFIRSGVWALAAVGLMSVESGSRKLSVALGLWLAGGIAACTLGAWKIHRLKMGGWKQPIDWPWIRRGLKVALPFLAATLALRSLFTLDRYWIEALGGLEVLGAYVLFAGMATALLSFLDAGVFVFLYPRLISAFNANDAAQFRAGMRSLSIQTLVFSGGFVISALAIIGPLLIWIDRPVYLSYRYVFPWILLAMLLHAASMIPHYGLYAQSQDRPIIRSHLVGLFAFIPSTWLAAYLNRNLAVPIGLCIAFACVLLWKWSAYVRLTPVHFRAARTHTQVRFD